MMLRRLLIPLLVLAGLLYGADRVAHAVAQGVVASALKSAGGLSSSPTVHIEGFPFLTQAISGSYDGIELQASGVGRGDVRLTRLTVTVRGARLPLSEALRGSVGSVPVDSIAGQALMSYAELAAAIDLPGLSITQEGSGVRLRGPVSVLGRTVQASAPATARLQGTTLLVLPGSVEVQGPSTPALRAEAAKALTLRLRLGTLPFGLRLSDLRTTAAGLTVAARVGPTVLHPTP